MLFCLTMFLRYGFDEIGSMILDRGVQLEHEKNQPKKKQKGKKKAKKDEEEDEEDDDEKNEEDEENEEDEKNEEDEENERENKNEEEGDDEFMSIKKRIEMKKKQEKMQLETLDPSLKAEADQDYLDVKETDWDLSKKPRKKIYPVSANILFLVH